MDFEAAKAFLTMEIEKIIQGRPTVPEGFLDDFVENKSGISSLMDEDLQKRLVRHLEEYFWTENSNGHSLSLDFKSALLND